MNVLLSVSAETLVKDYDWGSRHLDKFTSKGMISKE